MKKEMDKFVETEQYRFEMSDRLASLVKVKATKKAVTIRLAQEEDPDCSGILVTLRLLKKEAEEESDSVRKIGRLIPKSDTENTSGTDAAASTRPDSATSSEPADISYLYAEYGQEGSCSEENMDLYFRVLDMLDAALDNIEAQPGYILDKD